MKEFGKELNGIRMINVLDFLWKHLDYIAMIFLYIGYFEILKIKWYGWIWNGLGCLTLIISGFAHGLTGLAIGEIGFVFIAMRGLLAWKKKSKS